MLIAWDQIIIAALLASLLALLILLVFRTQWKSLTIRRIAGLTLCAGIGLILWFIIFNTFGLKAIDFDFPIPLFPLSPEDLSCMFVTGFLAFVYWFVVENFPGQPKEFTGGNQITERLIHNPPNFKWWFCLLPALAALIVDIYFI